MASKTSVNKNALIYLGLYQLLGGVIGGLFLLFSLSRDYNLGTWLIVIVMAACMAFSILCGMFCISEKEHSLTLSLFNQIIQLIGFSSAGITFSLMYCPCFIVTFDITHMFSLVFNLQLSHTQILINQEDTSSAWIEINIVACILIAYIGKLKKREKEAIMQAQADELGSIVES